MSDEILIIDTPNTPPIYNPIGGQILIFPFMVNDNPCELYYEETGNRPSYSIRGWISTEPLYGIVESTLGNSYFNFYQEQYRIWLGINGNDTTSIYQPYYKREYILEPNVTYYLNIKNNENSNGQYEMAILPYGNTSEETDTTIVIEPAVAPMGNETTMIIDDNKFIGLPE